MMCRSLVARYGFACMQNRSVRMEAKRLASTIPALTMREMYQSGELQQMPGAAK